MAQKWTNIKDESEAFKAEVKEIEEWWQTDRQKHIKRPYAAKSIAALRNLGFKIEYPSSAQGRKLWRIVCQNLFINISNFRLIHGLKYYFKDGRSFERNVL